MGFRRKSRLFNQGNHMPAQSGIVAESKLSLPAVTETAAAHAWPSVVKFGDQRIIRLEEIKSSALRAQMVGLSF
jgi:hypothetical protein